MGTSLASAIFVVVGAILIAFALVLANREARFHHRATRTTGVIRERRVDAARDSGGTLRQALYLTIEYEDGAGARRQATAPAVTGTSVSWQRRAGPRVRIIGPPDYGVGELVTILYDPDRPEDIRVDGLMNRWFGPLVLGIVGVGFLCVGLML